MSARKVALLSLMAVERQDAWVNGQLKKEIVKAKLDKRDAALATRLAFGTVQQKVLLDYYLNHFSKTKIKKMESAVANSLRLGLYQILFMDKIPDTAAVNESVNLVKKFSKNQRASGMVNGILRAILREKENLPAIKGANAKETLSIKYSHPLWLVEEFSALLPLEEVEALLAIHNESAETCVQVNTVKTTGEKLKTSLEAEGVTVLDHPFLQDAFILESLGNMEDLQSFKKGEFYVQDPAAKLAALVASPKKGDRVLDMCAAPGGKSFASAIAMENEGEIISCDVYAHKEKLLDAGAKRLGLSAMKAMVKDATVHGKNWEESFDTVICDVPCSGLGVIRKKPEIRYKNPVEMEKLPALQMEILENGATYVKKSGVLLYATCTLRPSENEHIVKAFLEKHSDFNLESFALPEPMGAALEGMYTFWPHKQQTDGFFVAKLRRKA